MLIIIDLKTKKALRGKMNFTEMGLVKEFKTHDDAVSYLKKNNLNPSEHLIVQKGFHVKTK